MDVLNDETMQDPSNENAKLKNKNSMYFCHDGVLSFPNKLVFGFEQGLQQLKVSDMLPSRFNGTQDLLN